MSVAQELCLLTTCTRAMHQEFIHAFGSYTNYKPAYLREAYRQLTGNASSASTTAEEVDKRVAKLPETEDPDLI